MSIAEIFEDMNYGSVSESDNDVKEWIAGHQHVFGPYISGRWRVKCESSTKTDIVDIESLETLATIEHSNDDLSDGVRAAGAAQQQWSTISALKRSQLLNGLAGSLLKKRNLVAKLESVSTGRLFQNVLNGCIPQAVRYFEYFAGWCDILVKGKRHMKSLGVMIINIPSNSSLSTAVKRIAPAIAAGNCVVLCLESTKESCSVNLGLFWLAELFTELSFPAGLFGIAFISEPLWNLLPNCGAVGGVSYNGKLQGGREISQLGTSGATLNLFLEYRYSFIIFETADIDSSVEAVIQAITLSYEQELRTILLVQESVQNKIIKLLKTYFGRLQLGRPLDTSADVGPLTKLMLQEVGEHFRKISTDAPQFKLPRLDFFSFRTAKEAAALINDCVQDVRASIWTENVTLAMELVKTVDASTVWINCFGECDPSVETGNRKYSGQGIDGGEQCLYQYLQPSWSNVQYQFWQKLPDYDSDCSSQIMESVKKVVESAHKSLQGWKTSGTSKRLMTLFGCIDALDKQLLGSVVQKDEILQDLYSWASVCDKCYGKVQEIAFKGHVLNIFDPVGVIAIVLSSDSPLQAFSTLVFSAISMGNAVVVFYEGAFSSIISSVIKELNAGGLPSGIINLESNNSDAMLSCIYKHNVQAVWLVGSTVSQSSLRKKHVPNTWVIFGNDINWSEAALHSDVFRYHATHTKSIWLPQGVTFAN